MTTPYVTGTVSVTAGSAIVTGVGTGWLTSGLVAGQFGLDSANGNPVPVLSIDSDTQITLAKPWRGTSASAQGYWITYDTTPGQQTVANAQRLAEYIARLDKPALAALASLVPAADKLPYFGANGAGALADFKAWARSLLALAGAANKIPYFDSANTVALADFNAAARALLAGGVLPPDQLPARLRPTVNFFEDANNISESGFFGLGGASPLNAPSTDQPYFIHSEVWPDINYRSQTAISLFDPQRRYSRIRNGSSWTNWAHSGGVTVGNVVRQNGQIAGAIIERGSNANGEYVRFADGTQICQMRRQFSGSGAGVRTQEITYPIAFVSKPQLYGAANYLASGFRYLGPTTGTEPGVSSATSVGIEVTNGGYGNLFCELRAEGRWF